MDLASIMGEEYAAKAQAAAGGAPQIRNEVTPAAAVAAAAKRAAAPPLAGRAYKPQRSADRSVAPRLERPPCRRVRCR